MNLRLYRVCMILSLTIAIPGVAWAQAYPSKPIRMVVGTAPGGTNDVVGRLVAQKLSTQLHQPIIVENRAGASGNIGGEFVVKSPPDGYTIYLGAIGTMVINPHLFTDKPWDTLRDFAPISQLSSIPQLLVVHPSVPAHNVRELIALAKAKPGDLNLASGASGSAQHLAGELFKSMTGTNIMHIPFKGGGPALIAVMGGQVSMIFDQIVTALPAARQGKLRALGVTTSKRSTAAPDIPTIAEEGVPGYDVATWHGLFVPAATPKDVVNLLSRESAKALQSREISEKFFAQGAEPVSSTPEQFREFLKAELEKWAKVVKESGAKLD